MSHSFNTRCRVALLCNGVVGVRVVVNLFVVVRRLQLLLVLLLLALSTFSSVQQRSLEQGSCLSGTTDGGCAVEKVLVAKEAFILWVLVCLAEFAEKRSIVWTLLH